MKDSELTEMEMSEEEKKLAFDAMDACYNYWKLRVARETKNGNYNTAVLWVQNNDTKHFFCFSRGEYVQQIKDSVSGLNLLDG